MTLENITNFAATAADGRTYQMKKEKIKVVICTCWNFLG